MLDCGGPGLAGPGRTEGGALGWEPGVSAAARLARGEAAALSPVARPSGCPSGSRGAPHVPPWGLGPYASVCPLLVEVGGVRQPGPPQDFCRE